MCDGRKEWGRGKGDLHHASHTTHTAHASHTSHATHAAITLLVGELGNNGLGGGHKSRHRASVLEGGPDNLGGIDHTSGDEVGVLESGSVESERHVGALKKLADDDRAFGTSVVSNSPAGLLEGLLDDVYTLAAVEVVSVLLLESFKSTAGIEKSGSTTGNNTLLDGTAGSAKSIVNTVALLLHFHLRGATNLDHGDTARELSEPLLEFLLLILRSSLGDGLTEELAPLLDVVLGTTTVEDNSVVLGNSDLSGSTEHGLVDVLELHAEVLGDDLTASKNSHILKVGLPVITEAGGLDGSDLDGTTESVHDKSGEGLTLNILGNDKEGALLSHNKLEGGHEVLHGGHLLLHKEDVGVLEFALLGLVVSDEIGGDESTVKLHSLYNFQLVLY
mmetsp:Transcript_41191/g.106469  ORF Transcript_41191/g.106469 Transcript_41191/m.106469 type:complete len:390 (-) Transcript_41191:699-1868(-)